LWISDSFRRRKWERERGRKRELREVRRKGKNKQGKPKRDKRGSGMKSDKERKPERRKRGKYDERGKCAQRDRLPQI